ncbi:IgGFc-binding protein-like [Mizuhopecten yessoensis]|nr:IgGFc-binding protein-like [Mizuhopecten yessoensis]
MRENGRASKGVILTSDSPVSVTAFNLYFSSASGGYLALPVESLGVNYIVGTARPNYALFETYGTSFAVGAPYDNTVVNITLSTSGISVPGQFHREGDKITVVLDKLDTFYIETNTLNQDLTGTHILSDKPVVVVSGNLCSYGYGGCNHLVEYLPPVSKWGTRFMVPPITRSISCIIRIISSVSNTNVVVISDTSNKTYSVSTHVDINTNSTQPYAISSDHPVLVLLSIYERTVEMTLVPSINQFSNEPVLVSTPTSFVYDNYIVVSIQTINQSGLQLRTVYGTDLSNVGSVSFPDADGEMYSFITVSCNNKCSVQHNDTDVAFSVIVYGFEINAVYAYPANLA